MSDVRFIRSTQENMVSVVKALRSVLREKPGRLAERHNLTFPRRNQQTTGRSRSWTKRPQLDPCDTRSEPGGNTGARLRSLQAQLQRLSFAEDAPQDAGRRRDGHMTAAEDLVREYGQMSLNSARFYRTVTGSLDVVVPTL